MKLQGKLIKKDPVKEYGSNGFRKRDIVIVTEDQYPQKILIELQQDNVELIKNFKKDDVIDVSINIRGREWINPKGESVFFNSIVGWKIEKVQDSEYPSAPAPTPEVVGTPIDDSDDRPF